MPITENGFEYTIPEKWLNIIDIEFLKLFRNELYKIYKISLSDFYLDSLANYENTSGWEVTFKLTCIKTNKIELYKYYRGLTWYDSDLFDGKLSELLIKNKLLLNGFFQDFISQKLEVKSEEIDQCMKCGKYYFKEDMIEDEGLKETEDFAGVYYCIHCNGFNSHQYYVNGLNTKV